MGFQTLIFDLGNVLVSFSHEKMFAQIAAVTGLSSEEVRELLVDNRIGIQYERGLLTSEEIFAIFQEKAPHSFQLPDLLEAASTIFDPRPEMEALVEILKKKGYRLIIVTNTSEPHFNTLSETAPFLKHFDHIILSYKVGLVKPEQAIFEYTLKQAGAHPSECLFIDDLVENVHAAERLGIRGHHFTTPSRLMEALIQHGVL